MKTEKIHISVGELWDKYTILLIKEKKIKNKEKLELIKLELKLLDENMNKYNYKTNNMFLELQFINEKLWDIEDNIRIKESKKEFDDIFIELARNVYITNDKRAQCKNSINESLGSSIKEVKAYAKYN